MEEVYNKRQQTCLLYTSSTGNIYDGVIPTTDAKIAGEFGRVMAWACLLYTSRCVSATDTPQSKKGKITDG